MSNVLTDQLPNELNVHGKKHKINSDFRTCLRIILAWEDNELAALEKSEIMLLNLYQKMPDDIPDAIEQATLFMNGGEVGVEGGGEPVRLFSFDKDANLIYSAFRKTHNIDLSNQELHWFQFLALFMDLGQNTHFCNLVALRKRVKTGKASKEERQLASELGEVFDLEETDTRTIEEKEAAQKFLDLVNKRKNDKV
jgi:hypothetical protein